MRPVAYLFPNELSALVEALTRDSMSERLKALQEPNARDYHLQNCRMNIRILEAFGYVAVQDAVPP